MIRICTISFRLIFRNLGPYGQKSTFVIGKLNTQKFEVLPITSSIQEKINTALRFASITTVDDDLSSKNAIEKRGKKTVFNDFNSKVNLIKEELLSQGANKQKLDIKLESYKKAYEVFEEKK